MKKLNFLYCLAILILVAVSCEKDNVDSYNDEPRVYFNEWKVQGTSSVYVDSKNYSFILLPSAITVDTFLIKVKVMGLAVDRDRVFTAVADTGTTGIAGVNYEILEGVIKANQIDGYLPIKLYRTEDIASEGKTLNIKMSQSPDFNKGVEEYSTFTLMWSDNLVKPDNWMPYYLEVFFGSYSKTKYRFIIDVLGISEFPLQPSRYYWTEGAYSTSQMWEFNSKLKIALAEYNSTYDPDLTDENGVLVTFP